MLATENVSAGASGPDALTGRVCFREIADPSSEPMVRTQRPVREPPATASAASAPLRDLNNDGPRPPNTANTPKTARRRYNYAMYFPIQGKRIRLCFNGDRFSKPVTYSISAFKTFDAFLEDVNAKVGRHAALLYGARHIFSSDGTHITKLDDMVHNGTYVCGSTTKFVPLNYDAVGVPKWTSTLNKNSASKRRPMTRPSVTRYVCNVRRTRQSSVHSDGDHDGLNETRSEEVPNLPNTEIIGFLGRGHSAEVFKARNPKGKVFAAKVIALKNENMTEFVAREIEIMKALRCEHVVNMFKTYDQPGVGQIIELEYMPDGDLFDYMKTNKLLDEYNCASVIRCLASALAYLHSLSIVHRDIKPENLLVYFDENKLCKVKITDFGLATRVEKGQVLFTVCGTPTYVAPEIIAKEGYSFEVDCWSTGVIMYVLLSGFPPFFTQNDDQGELFDQILEAKVPMDEDYLPEVSWSAKLLLRKLLLRSPKSRMRAKELLSDKWDPGLVTRTDEHVAVGKYDLLEEKLQNSMLCPPPKIRRFSNPDASGMIRPGRKHAFKNHRANTQLHQHYKKLCSSVPHQSSVPSSISDNDIYADSDSEDGPLEGGASAGFVFYRPAN